jgi:uncharacterized protein HemY
MSVIAEAADLLGEIAGPDGSKKTQQTRAWRRLLAKFPASSWTPNRVHDLFTKDPRARVSAQEIDELREAARVHAEITMQRSEFSELMSRLESLEHNLAVSDAEFRRPMRDAYREVLHGARRSGRSVADEL